jgi:hypothetical protein
MPKRSRNNNNGGKRKTQRTKSKSANRVPAAAGVGQLARLAAAGSAVPRLAGATWGFGAGHVVPRDDAIIPHPRTLFHLPRAGGRTRSKSRNSKNKKPE